METAGLPEFGVCVAVDVHYPRTGVARAAADLASEIERAGFTGTAIYGVEGPGWPLRQEWTDPHRREHILFAARSTETQPSLIGFSHHLLAAATKP
jgi:hypothetical protein